MNYFNLSAIIAIILLVCSSCNKDSKKCHSCKSSIPPHCDSTGLVKYAACCESTGPVQIYKTYCDYYDKVSVKLSTDKKSIVAFPGPTDAQYPIKLANGYLEKIMVGNAFLSITIDEYRKLKYPPGGDTLFKMIIDDDPFCEFYECCKLCLDNVDSINKIITENKLCNCDTVGWWIFN